MKPTRHDKADADAKARGFCCAEHDYNTDGGAHPEWRCACDCCLAEHGPSDADLERAVRSRESADIAHRAALRDAGRKEGA